jgi:putative transposase
MRKRRSLDQISSLVQQVQSDMESGLSMEQALRKVGVGLTTYYRWKSRVEDPVSADEVRREELEAENKRLKLLVAELAMDRRMLQEALKKKP